ncbi:MAG: response regulator transcription factor [Chloroflexi bacterium]|nr:response regulator transcription factor [Chloroflexota bacterium]
MSRKFVSIVLADDHKAVRKNIAALLEGEADLKVVGQAENGEDACAIVKRLRPDILVTDLRMGSMSGIEVARKIAECAPGTKTIILSMHGSNAYVAEAIAAGARGYVLKQSSAEDLLPAIHAVLSGGSYFSSLLFEQV